MSRSRHHPSPVATPEEPLVSVVIPCYNQAHFLGQAVESVLNQTYRNVEIVVVDDGSTDETPAVANRYPSVRLIRQKNQGLAGARNTGLDAARGDYIVFLDADDFLYATALESGVCMLRAHPECAFVSGAHRRVDVEGVPLGEPVNDRVDGDHYRALLRGNYIGMHAAVMYRRDAVLAAGGFDTSLPACEDYDLYLRLARTAPVRRHDEVVAAYRQHASNMSHDLDLMLRTVLSVLRSHRPGARADARTQEAYETGIRAWKDYYGRLRLDRIKDAWNSSADRWKAARELLALVRRSPRWIAKRMQRSVARTVRHAARRAWRMLVPSAVRRRLPRLRKPNRLPPRGRVRFGDLRRVTPISRVFGFDRGLPIDRYYIEGFLENHAQDVRGRVLEVGDATYTQRFGGDRVTRNDVLHVHEGNPDATYTDDLARGDDLPSDTFDCIILTQTLHLIYDVRAAVGTLYRILKPGGVLLATFPGISQIEDGEWGRSWFWSFTELSARRLFTEVFPADSVEVNTFGNVLAATAFLQGLATEEIRTDELDYHDPLYPVTVTTRAVKPA